MRKRVAVATGGAVVAAVLVGGGVAVAGGLEPGEDGSQDYTQEQADRATAAALDATGGGTATSVERDSEDGATWEVEVTKPDGTHGRRPPRRELRGRGDRGRRRDDEDAGERPPATDAALRAQPRAAKPSSHTPMAIRPATIGPNTAGNITTNTYTPRPSSSHLAGPANNPVRSAPTPATTGRHPAGSSARRTGRRPAGRPVLDQGVGGRDRHQLHHGQQQLADQADPGADPQRP